MEEQILLNEDFLNLFNKDEVAEALQNKAQSVNETEFPPSSPNNEE